MGSHHSKTESNNKINLLKHIEYEAPPSYTEKPVIDNVQSNDVIHPDYYESITKLYSKIGVNKLPERLIKDNKFMKYYEYETANNYKNVESYIKHIDTLGWRPEFINMFIENRISGRCPVVPCAITQFSPWGDWNESGRMYKDPDITVETLKNVWKKMTDCPKLVNAKFSIKYEDFTDRIRDCYPKIVSGVSLFAIAFMSCNTDMQDLLIDKGIDINAVDSNGLSAPMLAILCFDGHESIEQLESIIDKIDISLKTKNEFKFKYESRRYANTITIPKNSNIFDLIGIIYNERKNRGMTQFIGDLQEISELLISHANKHTDNKQDSLAKN
jgi:hypothetical protein